MNTRSAGSERHDTRAVVQLIAGDGRGGADRIALALGEGLRALGLPVAFAVFPEFLERHDLRAQGYTLYPLTRRRGMGGARDVRRRLADARLILSHDSGSRHLALNARLLGLSTPIWFMRHCISGTSRFGGVQLHRLLIQRQIAVSHSVAESLMASGYPASRVDTVHGGVALAPFASPDAAEVAALRERWLADVPPGTPIIGMVARFNVYPAWHAAATDLKGYDVLFAALARLTLPWRLLVVGPKDAADFTALRAMAAHHGADPQRLIFTGFVERMSPVYALMDLNVLPSRSEGLGLGAIEGMAAGVATVASASGGLREVITPGETGLAVPEGNAHALADALHTLLSEAQTRQVLATQGQRAALERFDAARMSARVAELIDLHHPARSAAQ